MKKGFLTLLCFSLYYTVFAQTAHWITACRARWGWRTLHCLRNCFYVIRSNNSPTALWAVGIFRIVFLIIIELMGNKELLARITVLEREVEQLNSRLAKLEKKWKRDGLPYWPPSYSPRGERCRHRGVRPPPGLRPRPPWRGDSARQLFLTSFIYCFTL